MKILPADLEFLRSKLMGARRNFPLPQNLSYVKGKAIPVTGREGP
jgi:hypothetical protein